MAGVGVSSVIASLIQVWYYVVIIGWSLFYLGASFVTPLPWNPTNTDDLSANVGNCGNYIALDYFDVTVTGLKSVITNADGSTSCKEF